MGDDDNGWTASLQTIGTYADQLGEKIKPGPPVDWRAWWRERGGGNGNVVELSPLRLKMLEREQRKSLRRA